MLTTGLIGLGGIGSNLAAEVRTHPDARLDAVVDVNEESLARATDEFGLDESACYTDETAMYDERDLDAVVIATPPAFHYDQILDAFDRGLHVLCEKPVVVDTAEARAVAERAADEPTVLMAGYQRHLNPGFVAGRERWAEGDREPTFLTGELTQDWRHHFEAGTNWRLDPEVGGGGHLFSVGTHVVESVLWMTGLTPASVEAEMEFYADTDRIDTRSALNVRFENGTVASLADSAVCPVTREHIHVWDDAGAVYLDGKDWERRTLTLVDADGSESTPDLAYDEAPTKVEAFVESVRTGSAPPATAEDALRVTALLDAAYESARTGERVPVTGL
ncbi:Gfo/Idh/MocA family protein [Candidatus Halobonum tyrrellensis]|uniref:Oxidoreductase domain-containing protein n=1 Tax=Candidatus Halobonum tyrrellensis G22 TaxID=1324957 RepID=V4HAD9_9EURY|nr:Gfo/Idh/MocA family oxidoreductase [Candidatus Halobonum tyrrellensis]ESP87018.1 oxidoreductase domain-containing protein [Candidatus Halobonum tyrrellensis G22]